MRVERSQPDYLLEEISFVGKDFRREDLDKSIEAKEKSLPIKEVQLSKDELAKKTEQLNATMDLFNRKFHFKVHDETNRVIVQILNSETGEIISEIPPEKVLDMVAGMEKAIGLLVDEKV